MEKENPKPGIEEIHLIGKGNHTQNGTLALDNIQSLHKLDITEQGEPNEKLGVGDHHSHRISGFPQLHEAVDGEVFQLNKILSNSSQEPSTSILGKFLDLLLLQQLKMVGPQVFLSKRLSQMILSAPVTSNLPDLLSGLMKKKRNLWMIISHLPDQMTCFH